MKVIIEAGVFRKDRIAERHDSLLALFLDCVRGRHTIAIEPSGTAEYRQWVDGEGSRTRELCERVLQNSVKLRAQRSRTREIRIADVIAPSWSNMRLPIAIALRILAFRYKSSLKMLATMATSFEL